MGTYGSNQLISTVMGDSSGQRFLLPDSSLRAAVLQVARDLQQVASLVFSQVDASRPLARCGSLQLDMRFAALLLAVFARK